MGTHLRSEASVGTMWPVTTNPPGTSASDPDPRADAPLRPDTSLQTETVLSWARAQLEGPVEAVPIKARPWASTWRLSSAAGVSFLKAGTVATRYEVPLMSALHRTAPGLMAPVLAEGPENGWLLLADVGRTLHEQLDGQFEVQCWEQLLAQFAELQRVAEPLVPDLIAAGVPDERPHRLFDVLTELLHDSPNLSELSTAERQTLLSQSDRWADSAAQLAQLSVPASVQHGDLHAGNVALSADGRARFFDFGDASIAHPFTTFLVPLQMARHLGAEQSQIERLQDSYLEVFTDLAPLRELHRGLETALVAAVLPKAAAWDRALLDAPTDHVWGKPVLEYLQDLL